MAVDFLVAAKTEAGVVKVISAEDVLIAPFLIDLEVMNVLRKRVLGRQMSQADANGSFRALGNLRLIRYPIEPLAARIWQLLFNMTPYDAAYVALAEALALPLYTRDGRLSRSVRHQADIRLV